MKKLILVFALACLVTFLHGQSSTVTNNNTIIIQGNVYYFQPSNTPSSPLPRVGNSNFISTGSWYGENAARAWASISDWAVERCKKSTRAIIGMRDPWGNITERIYISQVHAYRAGSPEINKYWYYYDSDLIPYDYNNDIGGIIIYYWIVSNGERMENGRREKRSFLF